MITLEDDVLHIRCPDVHEDAHCRVSFQRTLRLPDDGRDYPLPPGLGKFPLAHVDDYADRVPADWSSHGGVFLPMYQAEALWLSFDGRYPFAIKVAAGKINAVSGEPWSNELRASADAGLHDYIVRPRQRWLDGFAVGEGVVRQFVAMPLGHGYTAEEQLTGAAEYGGIQIVVYPMRAERYEEMQRKKDAEALRPRFMFRRMAAAQSTGRPLGLAPGGRMRQQIFADSHGLEAWDADHRSRCFVHLLNSDAYASVTGKTPPSAPLGPQDYTDAGLPWFEYYEDKPTLTGSEALRGLTSVGSMAIQKGEPLQGGNESVKGIQTQILGSPRSVREGEDW